MLTVRRRGIRLTGEKLIGGDRGSWSLLFCVTGRYTNRYTIPPVNLYCLRSSLTEPILLFISVFCCKWAIISFVCLLRRPFTQIGNSPMLSLVATPTSTRYHLDNRDSFKLFYIFACGERVFRHKSRLHLTRWDPHIPRRGIHTRPVIQILRRGARKGINCT